MADSAVFLWALLGLIWATGRILQIALSQKREKISTLVGFHLVAWAIFVGLALNTPAIPGPANLWLALGISIAFTVFLSYMYLPERVHKARGRKPKHTARYVSLTRTVWLTRFLLVSSCILAIWSVYNLYRFGYTVGYLAGTHDEVVAVMKILNVTNYTIPNESSTTSVTVIGLLSIVGGIIIVALTAYLLGLFRGLTLKGRPKRVVSSQSKRSR